ncbi:hypothetical protein GCM10028801_35650 [Nocardioides maradonensis]
MRTTPGLVGLLSDLGSLAGPEETSTELPHLLGELADQTGAAACQLDATVTSTRGTDHAEYQHVTSVGYPPEVADHLAGSFMDSHHSRLVLAAEDGLRIGDVDPYAFRASDHFRDVLRPAGFDDGLSRALRDRNHDVVGMLHLSATGPDDFSPDLPEILDAVAGALARITLVASRTAEDVTLPREYAVARVDAAGRPTPVIGRAPLHVALDEELVSIVRGVLATGMEFATFLHQQNGRLVEVRVHAPQPGPGRQPFTIATRPAPTTLGLTLRQLEVLTAVATGAGNRDIADELCLTQRTVAAHVEAILTRLGVSSRAGAAAKATAAGVLLPTADPDSVRSLARVFQRPVL